MEHFFPPTDSTAILLARQGFNAQYRRQLIPRSIPLPTPPASAGNINTSPERQHRHSAGTGEDGHFPSHMRRSQHGRLRSASEGLVGQINIPPREPMLTNEQSSNAPYALQIQGTHSPPFTPNSPRSLHERYSNQFKHASIEEEDGGDAVVIHNGVKRLSLGEARIVLQGKPKLVLI